MMRVTDKLFISLLQGQSKPKASAEGEKAGSKSKSAESQAPKKEAAKSASGEATKATGAFDSVMREVMEARVEKGVDLDPMEEIKRRLGGKSFLADQQSSAAALSELNSREKILQKMQSQNSELISNELLDFLS